MNTWIDNEHHRQLMEESILNEVPYSPTKHFLFDLPDIVGTILKWTAMIWLATTITTTMTASLGLALVETIQNAELYENSLDR